MSIGSINIFIIVTVLSLANPGFSGMVQTVTQTISPERTFSESTSLSPERTISNTDSNSQSFSSSESESSSRSVSVEPEFCAGTYTVSPFYRGTEVQSYSEPPDCVANFILTPKYGHFQPLVGISIDLDELGIHDWTNHLFVHSVSFRFVIYADFFDTSVQYPVVYYSRTCSDSVLVSQKYRNITNFASNPLYSFTNTCPTLAGNLSGGPPFSQDLQISFGMPAQSIKMKKLNIVMINVRQYDTIVMGKLKVILYNTITNTLVEKDVFNCYSLNVDADSCS